MVRISPDSNNIFYFYSYGVWLLPIAIEQEPQLLVFTIIIYLYYYNDGSYFEELFWNIFIDIQRFWIENPKKAILECV